MSLTYQFKQKAQLGASFFLLTILLLLFPAALSGQARIIESTQEIKTYPFGDPNPVPLLNKKAEIYPYFRFDGYTDKARSKQWNVVQLENDYIKLSMLPLQNMKEKNYKRTLQHIEQSREWPENLGSGRPFNPDERFQDYLTARVHRQQGEAASANNFQDSVMAYSRRNWDAIKKEGFIKNNYATYLIYKNEGEQEKADMLLKMFEQQLGDERFKELNIDKGLNAGPAKAQSAPDWLLLLREAL